MHFSSYSKVFGKDFLGLYIEDLKVHFITLVNNWGEDIYLIRYIKDIMDAKLLYLAQCRWQAISLYIENWLKMYKPSNLYWEIGITNGWIEMLVDFSSTFFWIFFFGISILFMGAKLISNISTGRDNYLALYSHFEDWEEELGSLDDSLYYILLMGVIIIWFYFFIIISSYLLVKNLSWVISIFSLVLLSGIIVPSAVLKHMGIYFSHYVRGSGRTTNIIFEIMLDVVSVSVIMIRFFIQNIRFVFIFGAFFELYEYIYFKLDTLFSYLFTTTFSWFTVWQNIYLTWSYVDVILQIWIQWFTYLYYLGHLTLLFIVQLSIYFILSFWLFFFLYTTFLLQPHEKYFFYKRHINVI